MFELTETSTTTGQRETKRFLADGLTYTGAPSTEGGPAYQSVTTSCNATTLNVKALIFIGPEQVGMVNVAIRKRGDSVVKIVSGDFYDQAFGETITCN